MAAKKVVPVKFSEKLLERVATFKCGKEPYETPLADWIKQEAVQAMRGSTKVWLYETDDEKKSVVGYGSLNKFKEPSGTIEADGSPGVIRFLTLPMMAMEQDFWGWPKDVPKGEGKYAVQLIRHLQREANLFLDRTSEKYEPGLVLFVHPKAIHAQSLYVYCGFQNIGKLFFDKKTNCNLQGMACVIS
jgi:hypothetical protein